MKLIEVDCPVCASQDYKVMYPDTLGLNPPLFGYKWVPDTRKMYRVVRCKSCGHAYCSPRLEDMYAYYKDVLDEAYLKNEDLRKKTAARVLSTIRQFKPEGKMLDVGCSTGDFLVVAKEFYDVEGLELSYSASELARSKGLPIYSQKLSEITNTQKRYDVVTLWGVIEHLEYPKEEMRHVNHLLAPGGIVCFWTGDVDSIYAKALRKKWLYLMGQHIQFFSRSSLTQLMRDCGFEKIYSGVYPYVMSFEYLGHYLDSYPWIGGVARKVFKLLGLQKKTFVIRKSDEIFAIYRKIGPV